MRSSPWSIRAQGAPYAVSRAQVLDLVTGELMERYSAWHGEPLEPRRRDIPMPRLLGVFGTAQAARACCMAHERGAGLEALAPSHG